MTDQIEFIYQKKKEAADALGVSEKQLQEMQSEKWFPKNGYLSGKGYCVELIQASRAMNSPEVVDAIIINRRKFSPQCPRSANHSARVIRVRGKFRECICNDCGHTWNQVGQYPDIRSETLSRIVKFLEEVKRSSIKNPETGESVKVILIDDKTVVEWIKFCRGAIIAKQ